MKKVLWVFLAIATISCANLEKDKNIDLNDKNIEAVSLESNETENNMQEFSVFGQF